MPTNYGFPISRTQTTLAFFLSRHTLFAIFLFKKNGHYIATITEYDDPNKPDDIYLIDTDNIDHVERMMTHQRFHKILDVHLSQNPDLIYTNFLPAITEEKNKHDKFGPRTSGIYLIIKNNIEDPTLPPPPPVPHQLENIIPPREVLSPPVSQIKGVVAQHVALSPDNKYLVYDTPSGVHLMKLDTGQVLRVGLGASMPTFSPDGTKLAVVYRKATAFGFFFDLDIYSVPSLGLLKTIKNINIQLDFIVINLDIKWSPDGEYIVYTAYNRSLRKPNPSYYHYAVPYDGGEQIRILDVFDKGVPMFDWTSAEAVYPVEPRDRLTTLWGKIKQ